MQVNKDLCLTQCSQLSKRAEDQINCDQEQCTQTCKYNQRCNLDIDYILKAIN